MQIVTTTIKMHLKLPQHPFHSPKRFTQKKSQLKCKNKAIFEFINKKLKP